MKAAVFKGAGRPLVVETVQDPAPNEGEAVIKVQRCGVCGTDLHMTSGHGNDFPEDSVIGHEFCGEVVALGKNVETLKMGQRVAAMPVAGCGRCAPCLSGYPVACSRMQGMVGGFGEYMRISAASSIVLPDTLSAEDGALIEPMAVGLRGLRLARMAPGAKVAVLGAGSIGLACHMA
jgi:threonine dehydrogenase-like Zn-dependent dehydrogenase